MSPLPPLVEPGAALTGPEIERYSRHLILPGLGAEGQRRLKNARVLVIGAGGLGSPALLYLAAAGVGTLGIADFDVVEESNLQRQVIHGVADIGRPKAESAREAIEALNPFTAVRVHDEELSSENALEMFRGYDLILDGTDNFATRYLASDAAEMLGLPCVWGSIYRFDGQVSVFWDAAPGGAGVTYRDLHPEPPPAGSVPSCAEGGVLGVLCASIGAVMGTEAIKLLTGIGRPLLGRLLILDALDMMWSEIAVRRDPGRRAVTELADYEAFCGVPSGVEVGGAAATVTARELAARLREREAGRDDFLLIDVREPGEAEIVAIPGAVLVPKGEIVSGRALSGLPRDKPIILHCKSGARSAEALAALGAAGFPDVVHLAGGVLAWIDDVAPGSPRY